ncbi:MAG: lipopolysaccharide assembly protein LapB [Burkholderiales bacterium]|nr:lipopolysaccharide assembly protein LapB [Burkholderiales bacterium]
MDIDLLQWLLIGLPVAFALGWLASRIDLRQWKRADRASPKAYFKGLNLLLNEQPDKAIDAFIEAVQQDPDTSELHFALGNLFRRRGEFERAVRVHQHLLQRGDLPKVERERAQHALAQDFVKAGLLDRAEAAFQALIGTRFETEARLALLALHERSRDWLAAIDVASQLEAADERGDSAAAEELLQRAQATAPQAARPLIQRAQRQARTGDAAGALARYAELRQRNPESFARVAADVAACAKAAGQVDATITALAALYEHQPSLDLLRALAQLEGMPAGESPRLAALLCQRPNLSAALELLDTPRERWPVAAQAGMREAVAQAARPLQRYRCAACGFESQRHFWQCPGCLSWDSFPPQRVEDL